MAYINLKDDKRINVNGEYDLVTTHPNNEPIYRSNGHQLGLDSDNADNIDLSGKIQGITNTNQFDLSFDISISDTVFNTDGECLIRWGVEFINYSLLFSRFSQTGWAFVIRDESGTSVINKSFLNVPTSTKLIEVKNDEILFDGVVKFTFGNLSINFIDNDQLFIGSRGNNDRSNYTFKSFKVQGETFNPVNINSNAQIEGSSGTIAQVNSSAADPINYILGTVFQKSGFALVGNGSTQKIVSPLGGEIVLTSTPLEGGFAIDGKTYNLTEGLGNVIKSTDGTTESDIVGFSGTSLNFGGWLKGDNINGWNPYTV